MPVEREKLPPIIHFQPVAGKVGFPTRNGPLLYLPFCNFRCDYCLNAKAVNGEMDEIPLDFIVEQILRNKESFVFISGGEPLFHDTLPALISELSERCNVKIGISTNGSYPERLEKLISNRLIDFVAMDIKTSPKSEEKWMRICGDLEAVKHIIRSIDILHRSVSNGIIGCEFRTTLYPQYVGHAELIEILDLLKEDDIWVLQQFRFRKGLLGGEKVSDITPYDDGTLYNWLKEIQTKLPNAQLRWP